MLRKCLAPGRKVTKSLPQHDEFKKTLRKLNYIGLAAVIGLKDNVEATRSASTEQEKPSLIMNLDCGIGSPGMSAEWAPNVDDVHKEGQGHRFQKREPTKLSEILEKMLQPKDKARSRRRRL